MVTGLCVQFLTRTPIGAVLLAGYVTVMVSGFLLFKKRGLIVMPNLWREKWSSTVGVLRDVCGA